VKPNVVELARSSVVSAAQHSKTKTKQWTGELTNKFRQFICFPQNHTVKSHISYVQNVHSYAQKFDKCFSGTVNQTDCTT